MKALCLYGVCGCADGMKTFPLVLAGGVLENDDGWDLCKPLMECVAEMFPRVQPIRPKVHFCPFVR